MVYKTDLHTHSTASDGQYSPSELAHLVKKRGTQVWALTDHDSVGGIDEALRASERLGLQMVRGVELSADDYLNLHILGYNFSVLSIQDWLNSLQGGRNDRKYRIRDFLRAKGLEISLAEVDEVAGNGAVGRPHFAQVMLRRGYVSTRKEAFDRYLDTAEFQKIEQGTKPSAKECVERIKSAGGVASLAHPYQIVLDGETLEELVLRLKSYGLDAIECRYPIHTQEQTEEYLYLTQKYGLHITGGSDFHGEKNKPDHPLAAWELELGWLIQKDWNANAI